MANTANACPVCGSPAEMHPTEAKARCTYSDCLLGLTDARKWHPVDRWNLRCASAPLELLREAGRPMATWLYNVSQNLEKAEGQEEAVDRMVKDWDSAVRRALGEPTK